MIFKSLRLSFIFILLVSFSVLIVPLILITQNITNKAVNLGINKDVEETLKDALVIAQERYQEKKRLLTRSVSAEIYLGDQLLSSDLSKLEPTELIWAVSDTLGRVINKEKGFPVGFISRNAKSYQKSEKILVYYQPISDNYLLWGSLILDDLFYNQSETNLAAVQRYDGLKIIKKDLEGTMNMYFIIVSIVMLGLCIIIGIFLSGGIIKPLKSLQIGTSKIARGDFLYRIDPVPRGELGSLTEAFNQMASQLESYEKEKLKAQKFATWQQIARQMAHEIKNPLTPITLSIQHLKDVYTENPDGFEPVLDKCCKNILEEISRLKQLVSDFHVFARFPEANKESINLVQFLKEFFELQQDERLKTSLTLPREFPLIQADKWMLKQVLYNLIQNSLQAKPEGEVNFRITLEKDKDDVVIRFVDDGPGIPENELKDITEPYFSTKGSGRGLGLTIVERIVDQHRGRLLFTNNKPNGLIVGIYLPIKSDRGE
jgi:two-component system, NtrC family, nitrogen regulation sensor histidine kinase NtrY